MWTLIAAAALALAGAAPEVTCRDGGPAAEPVERRDSALGPLSLMGTRNTIGMRRNSFDGRGWKLPAALPAGEGVTLTVPDRLHGRVGLVYTLRTQARVLRRGVAAADTRVTFRACAGDGAPARTGWPGGIVVDRRRCARLSVRVAATAEPIVRRVPLGKRCRATR